MEIRQTQNGFDGLHTQVTNNEFLLVSLKQLWIEEIELFIFLYSLLHL